MKKKILLSFIIGAICIFALGMVNVSAEIPVVVEYGKCGDSLKWVLYENGELLIHGTGDMWNWSDIPSVPWSSYRVQIKKVNTSNGITSIGDYAFSNTGLTRITIPNSVTNIGKYAFDNCSDLISVTIGNNVANIGDSAFSLCNKLTKATIYSRSTSFGLAVFNSVPSTFELGGYVDSSAATYANANGHKFVSLSDRAVIASGECGDNLSWILFEDGELVIDGTGDMWGWSLQGAPWRDYRGQINTITISDSVTNIGISAFCALPELVSITIPDSVTSIEGYTFYNCGNLTGISIPDSVTTIGEAAFSGCKSLTKATVYSHSTSFGLSAFSGVPSTFELNGYTGSTAETYASENGHKFVALDKETEEPTKPENRVNPFSDINESDWYYENVRYAVENKIMNGVASDSFAPHNPVTRAMLVTVLYRIDGEPTVSSEQFADVDANAYYANAVIWAKQNGIVNGVSETEFAPETNITREQIAAIMYRYAKHKGYDVTASADLTAYADAESVASYATDAMKYVVGSGLIKGKTATTLNPLDKATRAEIAAILQRFIKANK